MNKPTPGPWKWNTAAGIYGINGKRCVNVFVQDEINLPLEEMDANAALIVAAVNSCFAINPSNPLAVAEALPGLTGALKEIMRGEGAFNLEPMRHAENCIENMKDIARAALAKLEAK